MKTLITFLLLTTIVSAQERFTLGISHQLNDNINLGVGVTYEQELPLYHSFGLYINESGRFQATAVPIGYNLKSDRLRAYLGLVGGTSVIGGHPYPLWGGQTGFEYFFRTFGIGVQFNYLERSEADFYGGEKWKLNTAVRVVVVL